MTLVDWCALLASGSAVAAIYFAVEAGCRWWRARHLGMTGPELHARIMADVAKMSDEELDRLLPPFLRRTKP